jgi:hypothetical protein
MEGGSNYFATIKALMTCCPPHTHIAHYGCENKCALDSAGLSHISHIYTKEINIEAFDIKYINFKVLAGLVGGFCDIDSIRGINYNY